MIEYIEIFKLKWLCGVANLSASFSLDIRAEKCNSFIIPKMYFQHASCLQGG